MTAAESLPTDEHEIEEGVFGWLEAPGREDAGRGCLLVTGWAFSRTSPIVELVAQIAAHREILPYGQRRDDVGKAYPADVNAPYSGFSAYFEFENTSVEPVPLDVWARLEDGREIRLFSKLLRPYPPASRRTVRQVVGHALLWLVRRLTFRPVAPVAPPDPVTAPQSPDARQTLEAISRLTLRSFLAGRARLTFQVHASPRVSVVVVLWNRAELTFRCLRALREQSDVALEIILVDNQSTDETQELLARTIGATVIRNATNLGFTVAANLGAAAATGEFLLLLNNDAEVMPGSIQRLVETLERNPAVGASGGKLVFPDGRLQEAGSVVWSDGSCDGYGRGRDPDEYAFTFQRDVDFCSGAFLLTRRALFAAAGGFDERYRPAYYEDADYCVRLWESGHRVVYQPEAVAIHFEFASSSSSANAIALQLERRPIFAAQHRSWLAEQRSRADGMLAARTRRRGRRAVLVVDDAWPDPKMGSGFPRAAALLRALVELDCLVTFYPIDGKAPGIPRDGWCAEVEIVDGGGSDRLRSFIESRPRFDAVVVSRPHNLQYVKATVGADLEAVGAPVVYDAEAIYALREIGRSRVAAASSPTRDEVALVSRETSLARGCAAVLTVNATEQRRFVDAGIPNVAVLGHAVSASPTPAAWTSRHGLLFIGALAAGTPNEDAAMILVRDVLPALEHADPEGVSLTIAGARVSEGVKALAGARVTVMSDVPDLTGLYDAARVFVAPTRYSAGIPLKLLEAAAHGVPIVCTPQLADQLGWQHGRDVMVGETPVEIAQAIARVYRDAEVWQRLRESALARIAEGYAPGTFRDALRGVLEAVRRV